MTSGSKTYGNFHILLDYIERFMSVKLRSGCVPEFCISFVNNEIGLVLH